MANVQGSNRSLALTIFSTLLSLTACIVIIIAFIPGINGALESFALFKIDTSKLRIPSKLASSTFLKDLEKVSGGDLTGSSTSAKAFGLAQLYTIHLLTVCSHFSSKTTCSDPKVGWWFNPKTTLKFDDTSLAGSYSKDFNNTLDAYKNAAYFMTFGLIVAVVFSALAPILSGFSRRSRWLSIGAAALSSLSTVFAVAAGALIQVTSRKMVSAMNDQFGEIDIDSSVGTLPYLPIVALVLLFVASILYAIKANRISNAKTSSSTKSLAVGGKGVESAFSNDAPKTQAGFFQRATTWTRHKYVQVEEQPEIHLHPHGHDESRMMDPSDEVPTGEVDYRNPAEERDIAMLPLAKGGKMDLAYEPYRSQTSSS